MHAISFYIMKGSQSEKPSMSKGINDGMEKE